MFGNEVPLEHTHIQSAFYRPAADTVVFGDLGPYDVMNDAYQIRFNITTADDYLVDIRNGKNRASPILGPFLMFRVCWPPFCHMLTGMAPCDPRGLSAREQRISPRCSPQPVGAGKYVLGPTASHWSSWRGPNIHGPWV